MRLTAIVCGIFLASRLFGAGALFADDTAAAPASPAKALANLEAGNAHFVADEKLQAQRELLAKGQHPQAVVLTCSDSRVAPELIFQQQLGGIFVVRVAGNITDPSILGSIEYAVEHLHVPLIVVLGHSKCGAVSAAVEKAPVTGNLAKLVAEVNVAPEAAGDKNAALSASVRYNVIQSAAELTAKSDVIQKAASENHVLVVGAIYALDTGKVEWLPAPKAAAAK